VPKTLLFRPQAWVRHRPAQIRISHLTSTAAGSSRTHPGDIGYTILTAIIMFLLAQRHIAAGLAAGAVEG
jgi:ABC-type glycerol-3-phosphate transport system permease component